MKTIWAVLFLFGCASSNPSKRVETPSADKSDIVLMHGSHLDGTVWKATVEYLPQVHHVEVLNVPDRTRSSVPNLQQSAQQTCQQISKPSIFVVHSIAGVIVNAMVGVCPEKIQQIIYVAAIVTLPDERAINTFLPADQTGYAEAVDFLENSVMPKAPEIFYAAMAGPKYVVDESTPPIFAEHHKMIEEKVQFSNEVWQKITKNYIFTLEDSIISKATQENYVARAGIVKTRALHSGHLPMLTHPEYLAEAIMDFIP